ncbi:MAG TPA: NADH-quinone oxidoreductase subunit L [Tepidisphaeraceae bacterium]|nr:NADH-quinone oxidoreductase subunit L [Tepidisphaeraceae bacterium]
MIDIFPIKYSFLIPLCPLLGAIIAGFGCTGSRKRLAHWPIWIGVGFAASLALCLFAQMVLISHRGEEPLFAIKNYFTWIEAGKFVVPWGYLFDPLSAVMLCVVCGIGFLITVFAAGYMKGEEGYFRFFAYLGLFIFMMTNLVMGENLVMLYLGWEGVGLCSYLLIGYYYDRPAAREAAKKAFLVNRVGDFGFALGIMLAFLAFGTVSYFNGGAGLLELGAKPQAAMTAFQIEALKWIPFLLMVGAFGKSAQFPLYVWLPDAMEGPTPVSALIHAATMVTAGVYMIARCGTLFIGNHAAMITIACVGAFTAIFAASIALRQFDLKKVFAYSTVSQLGFMFVGVGCLAPVAGVFHLVTHAFFKALLFLSSGVVMHAMAGELDMRKMSGLKTVLPKTRIVMLIGCCALAGIPFFSGFFSKDEIVAAAWQQSKLLGLVMLITAFMTAYYTFRLYFRVFEGPTIVPESPHNAHGSAVGHDAHDAHDAHEHHNHEPLLMMLPLWILAVGALFAGWINWPHEHLAAFLERSPSAFAKPPVTDKDVLEATESLHHWLMIISGAIALSGVWLAYTMHLKDRSAADRAASRWPNAVRLLDHKYWIDEIYQAGIVEPLRAMGRMLFTIDRWVVDGIINVLGFVPQIAGFVLKVTLQRGSLQGYAAAMLLGIAAILLCMLY